jgi:hypothetical protein
MAKVIVYFQDLKESAQCRVRQAVQAELFARDVVEPQQEGESETAFEERLQSEVDYYLNCYNFAHEYCI